MANFDQLKQSVAALIRTNGAEETTGQIMQDVLLTIINSISGGYIIERKGVAYTLLRNTIDEYFYVLASKTIYHQRHI